MSLDSQRAGRRDAFQAHSKGKTAAALDSARRLPSRTGLSSSSTQVAQTGFEAYDVNKKAGLLE
jgi:hypothetical protein